ncbi:hypothetical protein SAMN02982922_5638 [Mesorhizobium australicum]|uniref:Uncharacterized protein n=1 Tax=Mesorhizobium australicum TaxID=536018 RepID=A0A1X7PZL5_9HYPH|nr:hypothetical protein SAMN02982922_5638 [Mesorhizobium australicum]
MVCINRCRGDQTSIMAQSAPRQSDLPPVFFARQIACLSRQEVPLFGCVALGLVGRFGVAGGGFAAEVGEGENAALVEICAND